MSYGSYMLNLMHLLEPISIVAPTNLVKSPREVSLIDG